jgi:hypothetical protein
MLNRVYREAKRSGFGFHWVFLWQQLFTVNALFAGARRAIFYLSSIAKIAISALVE